MLPPDAPAVNAATTSLSPSLETLESVYAAWAGRREERRALLERAVSERARLEVEGRFLVGAARAASGARAAPSVESTGEGSLARPEALDALVREAEARVAETLAAFEQAHAASLAKVDAACAELSRATAERVRRFALSAPVPVQLWLRPVGSGRAVVHLARPSLDGAVLLFFLLTGAVPSRHGYLFDESTEDLSLGPPPLYPDEGVAPADVRPSPDALGARLLAGGEVLPVRGFIPVPLDGPGGGRTVFRFLQRGPVLELEWLRDGAFQPVLPLEQAERVAGLLLRLRVEGRLQLEISSG